MAVETDFSPTTSRPWTPSASSSFQIHGLALTLGIPGPLGKGQERDTVSESLAHQIPFVPCTMAYRPIGRLSLKRF